MNKITNFENNIYRQEKLDIYFLMFLSLIFPKINEISLKIYLVIRISNLKNFDAFMDSGLN
jgi:hypothetical protein